MVRQLSLVDLMFAAVCGVPGPAVEAWRAERSRLQEPSPPAGVGAEVVSLELHRRAREASRP